MRMIGANFQTLATGFANAVVLANGGSNSISFLGTAGVESLRFTPASSIWTWDGGRLDARNFTTVAFDGRGGLDLVALTDGNEDDLLKLSASTATLSSSLYTLNLSGFKRLIATSLIDSGFDRYDRLDSELDYALEFFGDWVEV